MTADPNDSTLEGRLDQIADTLETRADIDPGAARFDNTAPAILQRINDAILEGGLTGTTVHSSLLNLSADDHPQYVLADGSRDITDTIAVDGTLDDDLSESWNGSILESVMITVTSDGTVISVNAEAADGGDLTCRFAGVSHVFDATPAASIVIAAGTDTIPVQSWVWLEESAGVVTLNTNTTGWPSTPFCPLATVICQSAASLETDGALKVHAWVDHISKASENGHISHINRKIRRFPANWDSDLEATNMDVSDPDAYLGCAAGKVFQLHNHDFPARQMPTDEIYVVNFNGTPYNRITTLDDIETDAVGNTVNNKYFSLVLWGSVNETETDCKIYLNLPIGTYNTATLALSDALNYAVYDMPSDFVGCGFLIARYVVQGKTSGAWAQHDKVDLRGQLAPDTAGGTGTGATILDDLGDVTLSGPVIAEFLRHDGADWKNTAIVLGDLPANLGSLIDLDELNDINIPIGPLNHEMIRWDSGSSKWLQQDYTLRDLQDISMFPMIDAVLIGNGSASAGTWATEDSPFVRRSGIYELTADWDAGAFDIEAAAFEIKATANHRIDDDGSDNLVIANSNQNKAIVFQVDEFGTTHDFVIIDPSKPALTIENTGGASVLGVNEGIIEVRGSWSSASVFGVMDFAPTLTGGNPLAFYIRPTYDIGNLVAEAIRFAPTFAAGNDVSGLWALNYLPVNEVATGQSAIMGVITETFTRLQNGTNRTVTYTGAKFGAVATAVGAGTTITDTMIDLTGGGIAIAGGTVTQYGVKFTGFATATGATVYAMHSDGGILAWAADNAKITIGGQEDAEIYFDGLDFNIDTDVIGTGLLKLASANNWLAPGGPAAGAITTVPVGGAGTFTGWLTLKTNAGVQVYVPYWI